MSEQSLAPQTQTADHALAAQQARGLTPAQLNAADRVLQRERSRSRVMVKLGKEIAASGANRPA